MVRKARKMSWLSQHDLDRDIATLKPDSMKGYTIDDNMHKELSKHPWQLDDEKLVYPAYDKFVCGGWRSRPSCSASTGSNHSVLPTGR